MKVHFIDTHLLVPSSRSSANTKVKYQSHISQNITEKLYISLLAPATRGLRNWWLPLPLWHMGGKSPQKQRRLIIIEQKLKKLVQNY